MFNKSITNLYYAFCMLSMMVVSTIVSAADRPAEWAVPMKLEGVGNLNKINANLYRSEQPTALGLKNIKEKLGVKTVINLRVFHSDTENAKSAGLLNEELSVKTWHIEDEDVVKVLALIRHAENGPFLVHCQHGADRTGLMSAMYRVVEQGWTKQAAIDELVNGGYGFHPVWQNILQYLNQVDVAAIRQQVDLVAPPVKSASTSL